MDIRQLKENIRNFKLEDGDLGSQGYTRVLLQLFGYTGHGKSSFINSCKYVLEEGENFREYAEAQPTQGGLTMMRNAYPLTDQITMIDNRGSSRMDDFERAEMYAQLGNFIPIRQKVDWKKDYSAMMGAIENSQMDPNFTDFLVPIFVYKPTYPSKGTSLTLADRTGLLTPPRIGHLYNTPPFRKHPIRATNWMFFSEMRELRTFLDYCVKMTGVFPIIVITFKTKGDFLETEKQFRLMGAETVIAIDNYTKDSHIKTLGRSTDILMVIDSALRNVRYRLEQPRDPIRERIERKKLIHKYILKIQADHEKIQEREKEEKKQEEEKKCTLL